MSEQEVTTGASQQDGSKASEMAQAKTQVQGIIETLGAGVSTEEEMKAWADRVRVAGRTPTCRFYLRKEGEIYSALAGMVRNEFKSVDLSITAVSAFANVVIDDDHNFSACSKCCEHGLLKSVLLRGKESISKEEESKLQYTIAIALTNFALQLEEQLGEEEEEGEEKILKKVLEEQNNPIEFVFQLRFNGANDLVKRAALSLLSRFAEFEMCEEQIFHHEKIGELLLQLCEECYSSDESSQLSGVQSLGKLWTKNSTCPPNEAIMKQLMESGSICIVSTLLRGTAEANGRELVFSDKVSCAAGEVLKDLVGTKEHDGLEKRQATLRECGVLQMAMDKLRSCVETPEKREVYCSATPGESLVTAAEVYLQLIEPVETNTALLDEELGKRVDEVLVTHVHLCGEEMERLVEDAKARRREKQSLTEDVDRKKILRFAKVRKVCLYLLAQFATTAPRCDTMISRKEKSLLSAENPAGVVPLCLKIIDTMAMFDLEAANTSVNLLRNFCLSPQARKKVLKQVDAKKLGELLLELVKSQNYNTGCVAAAIIRFFCSERKLELTTEMFPLATLMSALSMDTTKMHPIVRVELARSLSHILYTVATQAKDSDLYKKLFTVEVITLLVYLLQSDYSSLIAECLDALDKCPDDLLKEAGEKVPLYFAKDEVKDDGEDQEDVDEQLKELNNLEITEADTNMENQKADEKEKKEETVSVTLKTRLVNFANGKVELDQDLPPKAAKILKRVVDRI